MATERKGAQAPGKNSPAAGETTSAPGALNGTPRKITLATIGAQPTIKEVLASPDEKLALARIYGVASVAKPGASQHGPYVKFLGQFKAVNLRTGQVFTSNAMILPKFVEEQLFGAMGGESTQGVEFAFEMAAHYDESAATKYVYDAQHLLKAVDSEQMKQLESRISSAAALPNPNRKAV